MDISLTNGTEPVFAGMCAKPGVHNVRYVLKTNALSLQVCGCGWDRLQDLSCSVVELVPHESGLFIAYLMQHGSCFHPTRRFGFGGRIIWPMLQDMSEGSSEAITTDDGALCALPVATCPCKI